jgi:hypothetical protein
MEKQLSSGITWATNQCCALDLLTTEDFIDAGKLFRAY